MNKVILCGIHGRPSTKLVWSTLPLNEKNPITLVHRRRLTKKDGKVIEYYRVFGDPKLYNEKQLYQLKLKEFNFSNSIIIRWGTRETIPNNNIIVYNCEKALKRATDKKLSREIFINKGVNTPRLLTSSNDWNNVWVIARPHIHSKGKNFVVIKSEQELRSHWREGWYYSEFIDKSREFRVHCGSGKIIALMEKHNPENGNIAWNRAINDSEPFTWVTQTQSDEQNLLEVLREGLKAVDALGLDMGAADVIVDSNGIPYVLEVNTAPTLNSSLKVANMWGKYWNFLLKDDVKKPHWDFMKFKKASSLFWKQDQF